MPRPWTVVVVVGLVAAGVRAPAQSRSTEGQVSRAEVAPSSLVSDSDKSAVARGYLAQLHELLSNAVGHLGKARDDGDVVKLNCVNEKLTAIKGLVKVAEQSAVQLEESLARRDAEVAAHEFDKLELALRKSQQFFAESEACVGEYAVYSGDTEVQVDIDPDVARLLAEARPAPITVLDRPPAASPYQ